MMMMRLCWDFYIFLILYNIELAGCWDFYIWRAGSSWDIPSGGCTTAAAAVNWAPWTCVVHQRYTRSSPVAIRGRHCRPSGPSLSKLPPPTIWRANEWGPAASSGAKRKETCDVYDPGRLYTKYKKKKLGKKKEEHCPFLSWWGTVVSQRMTDLIRMIGIPSQSNSYDDLDIRATKNKKNKRTGVLAIVLKEMPGK